MQIRLLFLFVLVSGQTNKTDLGLLLDKLSILSRVTNAIALQIAVTEQSVQLEDVLIEIVGMSKDNLTSLLKIDNEKTLTIVTEFFQKSEEANSNNKISLDTLNQYFDHVKQLYGWLELYETFNLTKNKEDINSFLTHLENSTLVNDLLICDNKLLKVFTDFYLWIENLLDVPKIYQLKIVEDFRINFSNFQNCLDEWKNYKSRTSSSPIVNAFKQLKLNELAEAVDVLQIRNTKRPKSIQTLQELQSFYQKTKILRSISVGNTPESLKSIFGLLNTIDNSKNEKQKEFTAGFRDVSDLSKVFTDIKSEWFKEQISKGADLTKIENALIPFKIVAEAIEKVGKNWTETTKSFQKADRTLQSVEWTLTKMKRFPNSTEFNQTHIREFNACWDILKAVDDRKELDKFYEAFGAPMEINGHLGSIMSSYLKLKNADLLGELTNSLPKINSEIATVHLTIENIERFKKGLKNNFYNLDLYKGLKIIADLLNFQTVYGEAVAKTRNTDKNFFDISNVVTQTKTLEVINCLDTKAELRNLYDVFEYLILVKQMANRQTFESAAKVLVNLKNTKTSLKLVTAATSNVTLLRKQTWKFPNSKYLASALGEGVHALRGMDQVKSYQGIFIEISAFENAAKSELETYVNPLLKTLWRDPIKTFNNLVSSVESMMPLARKLWKTQSITDLGKIFEVASNISGLPIQRAQLKEAAGTLGQQRFANESVTLMKLSELDLDFAKHDLNGAAASLIPLEDNFNVLFGHVPSGKVTVLHDPLSYVTFVLVCVALVLVLACMIVFFYGLTPSGRDNFKNVYLYYLGKSEDFEKRWRYSLFLDRLDGKNALIDAVREVNETNVLKALKRGAYVDVYNFHGNTPLHTATKLGHVEIVKMLIKNGADRNLLNYQNKIPEEMIPKNFKQNPKSGDYEAIQKIYDRYRRSSFRINVPEVFPVSSFHIYIEERTDNHLTNAFMEKFQSITSDEPLPTTTHCIVKTDDDGTLSTDQISLLVWIFNGVIIVKEKWMSECLKDGALIRQDSKFLVEKVRYNGVIFEDTVLPWSRAMAKGTMPFLHGVFVAVVMREYPNLLTLATLVAAQGGTMLNSFPQKENYNRGSHPYLHANLGPLFIIHDGQINLDAYRSDEMFTLFTETQFLTFMLRRGISQVSEADPVSVAPTSDKP